MDWEFGVGRRKLLYLEWINNKLLMCSTGNYIQYPIINYNEKNWEKKVHTGINRSLCCSPETNTIL